MKKKLFSIDLTTGSYASFVRRILSLSKARESSYVCVANVHMLVEASRDREFARVVNTADIITPDGMPLVKSLKLLFGIRQDRVAGMDLLPDLLASCEREQLSVYFYGGAPSILKATAGFVRRSYPALEVTGYDSPPFRELTDAEMEETAQRINKSGANIVFVILGCPKQERWMNRMKGNVNACMIGVGGALPVLVGARKRAPLWMQQAALEWLYRFMQEPFRLGPRYFKTNLIFLRMFFTDGLKTLLAPAPYSPPLKERRLEKSAVSEHVEA